MKIHSIKTGPRADDTPRFEIRRGGAIAWIDIPPCCSNCNCRIETGKGDAETEAEFLARFGGKAPKRGKVQGKAIACVNCGHTYEVKEEA